MKKLYSLLACFLIFCFSYKYSSAQASKSLDLQPSNCTVSPIPVDIVQPNNTAITVIGKGNMNNSWSETTDGFTIVRNNAGVYEYAIKQNGNLVPNGVEAHNPNSRTSTEQNYLSNVSHSIKPDLSPLKSSILNQVRNQLQNKTYPATGNLRVLALLIDYPDLQNTFPSSNFDSLLYGKNYRNGDGSFKAYYETASDSQVTIQVDVFGWFRADSSYLYYGRDSGTSRAAALVREAVDAAEIAGVDFSNYDNDNDNDVDGILAVHSGPGAERGSRTQYIWSHRWVLSGGASGPVTYDGVTINDYIINPEVITQGSSSIMIDIGVFCHEFGHNLGLPDLYDTDDSNGNSAGIGEWGVMAGGGYLGGGNLPSNFCAWSKVDLGWTTPTTLNPSTSGIYSLRAASKNINEVYRVNTSLSNEYFLLENRQQTGLDIMQNGEGLAIWHINTDKTNSSGNRVNGDVALKGVDLEEADGNDDLDSNTNRGDAGDLYPGSSTNRTFNNTSTPNSNNYLLGQTNIEISNIKDSNNVVSFSFGPAPGAPCNATTTLTSLSGSFDDGGGNLDYAHNQNCSWLIQPPSGQVQLSFSAFNTQIAVDTVTIYDGSNSNAPILRTLSGNLSTPISVTSTGNSLFITFKSDSTITFSGWSANYTSFTPASPCGTDTLTAINGSFTDGSGANNYANNADCSWLIQPPSADTITLVVDSVNTFNQFDLVRFYDGVDSNGVFLGSISGNTISGPFVASSGSLFALFATDNANNAGGWGASYSTIQFASAACSGTSILTSPTGTFEDGSGPMVNYNSNQNCSWLIQPSGVSSIDLTWNYFATESMFDVVSVYDGANASAPSLGTFSGSTTTPPNISSTGGSLFIEFSSNGSTELDGFEASYTSTLATLSANPDTVTINAGLASNGTFNISSNSSWSITDNASWLAVNPSNGSNNQNISVIAIQANIGPARTAEVYISSNVGNLNDTIIVIQRSSGNFLVANPDTLFFGYDPVNSETISLLSNVNWNISTATPWLSIATTSGTGNGSSAITATTNSGNTVRDGFLVIGGTQGVSNDTVFVVQDIQPSLKPSLSVNPKNLSLASTTGSNSAFTVNSNVVWQTAAGDPWITITNPASTVDTNTVQISANSANTSTTSRSSFVVVQDVNGTLFDTVFVTQLGNNVMLSVSPNVLTLNNPQGSNASSNLSANLNWTATNGANWLSVSPSSGSSNTSLTITANSSNLATTDRTSYIAIEGGSGAVVDTIFVTQIAAPKVLTVSPSSIALAQTANSMGSFTINSNVDWQTLSGATWLTISNPASTSDTGVVQLTANSMNMNPSPRTTFVAVQDVNGTLFDTVQVSQLGSNPTLSSNPDTLVLAKGANSSATFNLISNGDWKLTAGDSWLSSSPSAGSGNLSISVTSNSSNPTFSNRVSYIAIEDTLNNLFDTVVVVQEEQTLQLTTSPDTIRIGSGVGNQGTFNIDAPAQTSWNTSPNDNWINLSQLSGTGNSTILVTANSANTSKIERVTYIVTTDNNFNPTRDTVYVIQEGIPSNLSVTPSNLNLNFTMGSNDNIIVTSNENWTLSNPVTWLSVNPSSGSNDGSVTVTTNSDNLSGSNRSAMLTFSASGLVDQIVNVTQIDGSQPNFAVSRDTVYVDNPQGSTGTFAVLSNISNWSISENTPWLLVNPQSGSNTETITVLMATKNVLGNERSAEVTVSATGFNDQTVTIIQRPTNPLFQIAPTKLIVGPNFGDFNDFNISSNLTSWTVSTSEFWMSVSQTSGSFTEQLRITAVNQNNTGNVRTGIITVEAAPLVPQTIIVTQDTIRTIGLTDISIDDKINIYPNPTRSNITLEFNENINSNEVNFDLYSALGKRVQNLSINRIGNKAEIKLESLAKGIYFLQLNHRGKVISRKISVVE